jgi:porphobilinogen deaminase
LRLDAVVLSADGTQRLAHDDEDDVTEAEALGARVAGALLAAGAGELIDASRHSE